MGVAVLSLHDVGGVVGSLVGVIVGAAVGIQVGSGLGAGVLVLAQSFSHSVNFALDGDCGLQKVGSRVVTPLDVHTQRPITMIGAQRQVCKRLVVGSVLFDTSQQSSKAVRRGTEIQQPRGDTERQEMRRGTTRHRHSETKRWCHGEKPLDSFA